MRRLSRRVAVTFAVLGSLAFAPGAGAQSADTEVVTLDRDLVRLNTSNPPGNEAGRRYMRDRLAPLGFEVDVIQTPTPGQGAPDRAASQRATRSASRSCCRAHADTVGVERDLWSVDPFAGAISGDYLYGRGSFDDKGGIAVFAAAAMRLARARAPLDARHRARLRGRRGGRRLRDRLAGGALLGQAGRRLLDQRGRNHEHRRRRAASARGGHRARQDLLLGRAAHARRVLAFVAAAAAERDRSARSRAVENQPPSQQAEAVAPDPRDTSARSPTPATGSRPPTCAGWPAPMAAARSSGSPGG